MKRVFGGGSILGLLIASAVIAAAPVCLAQHSSNLDKHARKVESRLAKFPAGSHLHLFLRDHTDSYGTLGALSEASFSFTNADTNAKETHLYRDVSEVKKGEAPIGKGSVHRHRIHAF